MYSSASFFGFGYGPVDQLLIAAIGLQACIKRFASKISKGAKIIAKRLWFAFKTGVAIGASVGTAGMAVGASASGRLVFFDTIFGGKGRACWMMLGIIGAALGFVGGVGIGLFTYPE